MHVLLGLLIVAAAPETPIEGRFPDATEVFHCAFDEASDRDCDGWPDRWTRRRGPGFPHYVKMYVDTQRTPDGQRALRVDLDGGGAVAYGPPVPASSLYDYVLECLVQTEGLHYDSVALSITFRDENRQELETLTSRPVRDAPAWKKLRLGPVSPRDPKVKTAIVGLHVQGTARSDLKGTVLFSDVWLGRLPRMTLATGREANLFTDPGQVAIDCRVSGLTTPAPTVEFELVDVSGKPLARSAVPLRTKAALESRGEAAGSLWGEPAGLVGTAQWRPAVPGVGFYRVRASMAAEEAVVHRRELSLVVIEPRRRPAGGEFGWSLPRGDRVLPLPLLDQWIAQAGVHWIKYPLGCSPNAPEAKVREMLGLIERLSVHGIETVGMLEPLSEDLPGGPESAPPASVAELFSPGREAWGPSLEATMLRLGGTIRWWQLGSDRDASFVGYPRLAEKIAEIKAEMDRVSYDANLGLGWSRTAPVPEAAGGKAPWRFLALGADPPRTPDEPPPGLQAPKQPDVGRWVAGRWVVGRWVVVEPLPRAGHTPSDRAVDLVQRMVGAKIAGAEGIFVADPFGDERGLIHDDGTPGELFLPWRTAALTLGGSEPLGELTLPGGSANRVFARPGDAVMIVWSPKPGEEPLGPGQDVRQLDLWGRSREVKTRDDGLRIEVGPEPTFVTGLNGQVTRWQVGLSLLTDRMPSVPGQRHRNGVDFTNSFLQGVEGTLSLAAPEGWSVQPQRVNFRLAAGETAHQPIEIVLAGSASSAPQVLRADFEVLADRPCRFSVYRPIHVGLGDVRIEVASQLNGDGALEVQQRLVNETKGPIRFRCSLYVPERRLLGTQAIVPGRGFDLKTYRLPDGKALVGQTLLLEAKEVGGLRVLSYRFRAEP